MSPSSSQRVVAVDSGGSFVSGGRGPVLKRWLEFEDLLFPDSGTGFAKLPARHVGAQTESGWVLFHEVQVIQRVPEEVHSYWHREANEERSCSWRVDDSSWLASFSPQHLSRCQHYILEFYDDVLELVCEGLIFGPGEFDIAEVAPREPKLRYAYMRRAISLEKDGRLAEARDALDHYLASRPDEAAAKSAKRRRGALHIRLQLERVLDSAASSEEQKVAALMGHVETEGWEALRVALLTVLYDDTKSTWWSACLEAHTQLLSTERKAVVDTHLIALAIHRLGEGRDATQRIARLTAKLGFEGSEELRGNVRIERELSRLARKRS